MTAMKAGVGLLIAACLAPAQFGWFHGGRHPEEKKTAKDAGAADGFVGLVIRVRPDLFVVEAADVRIITFKIVDSTLYFKGSKWASPSQLKRGAVVKVDADADRDGVLTAMNVVFQDIRLHWRPGARASDLLPGGVTDDPLVEKARQASNTLVKMLPNFLCQQSTTRSYAGDDKHWRTLDNVTAEVLYEHGHESYREVKLNGKATGRSMMDLPGSRSTGEFGSTLRALFDPETQALFKFQANATLTGFATAVYDLAVAGARSDWRITAGSQMIMAAYTGKIWIDRESGSVVRIEKKAVDIPEAFPFQRLEAEVDYGPVMLPAGRYFLPARAENLSCNNPKSCSRNLIEFRNYHKYVGESSISFDAPEDAPPLPDARQ